MLCTERMEKFRNMKVEMDDQQVILAEDEFCIHYKLRKFHEDYSAWRLTINLTETEYAVAVLHLVTVWSKHQYV